MLTIHRTHRRCPSDSTVDSSDLLDSRVKSQLCKKFLEKGCPYGNRCKFAHGTHELRTNDQLNRKYKTKQCGSFTVKQFCPFGDRCNFLHTSIRIIHQRERQPADELLLIRTIAKRRSRLLSILCQQ